MRSLIALLVLAFAAVAYGQFPTPCYAPREMEARIIETDWSKNFTLRAKLSYDSNYRRVRIIEEVNLHDKKEFFDTIYFHDLKVEYVFNMATKKCEKRPLSRPWRSIEIPHDAKFYGELYLGDMLLTQSWGGKTREGGDYHLLWSVHDCLPITQTYFSQKTSFVHTTFYDITLGISDPNVFIPPHECQ